MLKVLGAFDGMAPQVLVLSSYLGERPNVTILRFPFTLLQNLFRNCVCILEIVGIFIYLDYLKPYLCFHTVFESLTLYLFFLLHSFLLLDLFITPS